EPPKPPSLLDRAREMSEAETWKPEVGDGIEGVIVRIIRDVGRFHSTHYYIKTASAIRIVVANADTNLARKLDDWTLGVGDRVGILYPGEKLGSNGRTYKDWSIFADKAQRSQVGNPPADDDIPF